MKTLTIKDNKTEIKKLFKAYFYKEYFYQNFKEIKDDQKDNNGKFISENLKDKKIKEGSLFPQNETGLLKFLKFYCGDFLSNGYSGGIDIEKVKQDATHINSGYNGDRGALAHSLESECVWGGNECGNEGEITDYTENEIQNIIEEILNEMSAKDFTVILDNYLYFGSDLGIVNIFKDYIIDFGDMN